MMGSFLTRGFILALGYAYPAYECYKTVDKNKPDIEKLRFWCQYWILVAALTVFERVGDTFISWLPMYSEAKLAFYIYLWCPKTRGTTYVYDTFFQPYVAKHETEIDRNLLELRTRAGDFVVHYMQRAAVYGQTRFFEILQFVVSQSQPSRTQPVQQRQQQVRRPAPQPPPIVPSRQQATVPPPPGPQRTSSLPLSSPGPQQASSLPASPAKGSTREPSLEKAASATVAATTSVATPASATAATTTSVATPVPPQAAAVHSSSTQITEASMQSNPAEADSSVEPQEVPLSKKEEPKAAPNPNPAQEPKETVMEETIRVTRGRLRKTRSTSSNR